MNRMRRLVTAVAVAASMALVLPGSATAQAAPQVNQEYDFQLPSVPGLFAPGRVQQPAVVVRVVIPPQRLGQLRHPHTPSP